MTRMVTGLEIAVGAAWRGDCVIVVGSRSNLRWARVCSPNGRLVNDLPAESLPDC